MTRGCVGTEVAGQGVRLGDRLVRGKCPVCGREHVWVGSQP